MSPDLAISVQQLSKRYRLGGAQARRYTTLRDRAAAVWEGQHVSPAAAEFWALRDVSFDVGAGQALGIIGPNGAGKSTLLKVLSRITEPSAGRALVRGRVASLLEVGTGFHPELTGRENIYLNGTILGMTTSEVRRHFDAIVAFAQVEAFLDTPVKHYSSGMYVRLAFAVAAHLTPEILIIDEVLAVGDAEFQKRCLGRMQDVARSGRTVLFVSHNLAAVEEMCPRAILLRRGRVEAAGATREVVATYLPMAPAAGSWDVSRITEREGTGSARITRLDILTPDSLRPCSTVPFLQPILLRMHFDVTKPIHTPVVGWGVLTERGERVALVSNDESGLRLPPLTRAGAVDCLLERPNLLPGAYALEAWISEVPQVTFADHLRHVGRLEIVPRPSDAGNLAALAYHDRGRIYLESCWNLK